VSWLPVLCLSNRDGSGTLGGVFSSSLESMMQRWVQCEDEWITRTMIPVHTAYSKLNT
jgi:hypothetical protein